MFAVLLLATAGQLAGWAGLQVSHPGRLGSLPAGDPVRLFGPHLLRLLLPLGKLLQRGGFHRPSSVLGFLAMSITSHSCLNFKLFFQKTFQLFNRRVTLSFFSISLAERVGVGGHLVGGCSTFRASSSTTWSVVWSVQCRAAAPSPRSSGLQASLSQASRLAEGNTRKQSSFQTICAVQWLQCLHRVALQSAAVRCGVQPPLSAEPPAASALTHITHSSRQLQRLIKYSQAPAEQ